MRLDPAIAGPQGRLSPVKLGALYEKSGQWLEAAGVLEQATRSTPEDAESFAYLALAYQNLHELDKAAAAYREAIRLNPSLVICRYNLGILALKVGDASGAREQLEALETQDAKLAQALRELIRSRSGGGPR
jgi:Flp pilus assembly protein TadD